MRLFICDACGQELESEWTEEEALAEMRENFGEIPLSARRVVCDDCYQEMRRREADAQIQT